MHPHIWVEWTATQMELIVQERREQNEMEEQHTQNIRKRRRLPLTNHMAGLVKTGGDSPVVAPLMQPPGHRRDAQEADKHACLSQVSSLTSCRSRTSGRFTSFQLHQLSCLSGSTPISGESISDQHFPYQSQDRTSTYVRSSTISHNKDDLAVCCRLIELPEHSSLEFVV